LLVCGVIYCDGYGVCEASVLLSSIQDLDIPPGIFFPVIFPQAVPLDNFPSLSMM